MKLFRKMDEALRDAPDIFFGGGAPGGSRLSKSTPRPRRMKVAETARSKAAKSITFGVDQVFQLDLLLGGQASDAIEVGDD